jgi:hypothetical protein
MLRVNESGDRPIKAINMPRRMGRNGAGLIRKRHGAPAQNNRGIALLKILMQIKLVRGDTPNRRGSLCGIDSVPLCMIPWASLCRDGQSEGSKIAALAGRLRMQSRSTQQSGDISCIALVLCIVRLCREGVAGRTGAEHLSAAPRMSRIS